MIRCIVIEDQAAERELLCSLIADMPDLQLVGAFADPVAALPVLEKEPVQLVISDIEMPRLDGLSLLKSLANPPAFIFVTSHAEHALEGFEVRAVDFILKPITFQRLLKAVSHAKTLLKLPDSPPTETPAVRIPPAEDFFWIRADGQYTRIANDEVLFVESVDNFIKIHTPRGIFIAWYSLKTFEEQFQGKNLFRIHKSFIVNLSHIESVTAIAVAVGGKMLPISRSFREALMEEIERKLIKKP